MNKFCTLLCIVISLFIFIFGFFTIDREYYQNTTIGVVTTAQADNPPPNSEVYKVTQGRIIDGDTFQIHRGSSRIMIRLACIDAPELTQAYGLEVKYFVEDTFASYDNDVTYKEVAVDSYGRTVSLVFLPNGESINERLVRMGWAFPYTQYKDTCPIWPKIEQASKIAEKHDINLYQFRTVRPWIYRKLRKSSSLI